MGIMMKKELTLKISLTGLMAALSYAVFTFVQIKIPLPGQDMLSIHLGNAVCVLAALLLGGFYGGISGAIGMTIGDLMDPIYVVHAPKTFLLKLCIGLIVGLIAHRIGHISRERDGRRVFFYTGLAAFCALLFNAFATPIANYYYNILFLGKSAAELSLIWNFAITFVGALINLIVSVLLYMALRPALKKAGFFLPIP